MTGYKSYFSCSSKIEKYNLRASSDRVANFLRVEVIIDQPVNDGWELRFYQSIARGHQVRQDGPQGRANLETQGK